MNNLLSKTLNEISSKEDIKLNKDIYNEIKSQKSSAYLYLNEEYYCSLILRFLSELLYKNCTTKNFMDEMSINDLVDYNGENYKIENLSSDGMVSIQQISGKGKYWRPTTITLPKEMAQKKLIPIKKINRGKDLISRKNKIEKTFNLQTSYGGSLHKALIICEKITKDRIEKIEIQNGTENYPFSWYIPSTYSTKNGNLQDFIGGNPLNPIVFFTSDLEEAYSLMEEYNFNKIYIFGSNFIKVRYHSYLRSVLYFAKELAIPIQYYGCLSSAYYNENLTLLKDFGELQFWTPDKSNMYFDKMPKLNFSFFESNPSIKVLNNNLDTVLNLIKDINMPLYYYLKRFLLKINTLPFSECLSNQDFKDSALRLKNDLLKLPYNVLKTINIQNIFQPLLNDNPYTSITSEINKYNIKKSDILIVEDYWYEETIEILKKYNISNKVISTKTPISNVIIQDDNNYCFLNIRTNNINPWLLSMCGKQQTYHFNRNVKKYVFRTLNYTLQKTYLLIHENQLSDDKNYVWERLEKILHTNKTTSTKKYIFSPSHVYEMNDDDLDDQIYTFSNFDEQIIPNPSTPSVQEENQIASVSKVIELVSGAYFLATTHSYIFVVEENRIKKIHSDQLKEGMMLIYFSLPSQYKLIEEMVDRNLLYKNSREYNHEEKLRFLDWYWRNEFIQFSNSHGYTNSEIQALFREEGYNRSNGFFQYWTAKEHKSILPQDCEFIKYIGKVIGNTNIEENYISFYKASSYVKDHIMDIRSNKLNSFINKDLDLMDKEKSGVDIIRDKILVLKYIPKIEVNRSYVNKFIDKEDFKEVVMI